MKIKYFIIVSFLGIVINSSAHAERLEKNLVASGSGSQQGGACSEAQGNVSSLKAEMRADWDLISQSPCKCTQSSGGWYCTIDTKWRSKN